ncbi:hypothetical protein [Sorangium sp. So ce233]|uniref:hypothetical protein n=1 Tax=Sorangium sp. So ce233 TaxID=3133290 RepID=UPI003F5E03BF
MPPVPASRHVVLAPASRRVVLALASRHVVLALAARRRSSAGRREAGSTRGAGQNPGRDASGQRFGRDQRGLFTSSLSFAGPKFVIALSSIIRMSSPPLAPRAVVARDAWLVSRGAWYELSAAICFISGSLQHFSLAVTPRLAG